MTTIAQNEEFNALKAQMQVLKNHLSNNEVISQEMVDASVKSYAKDLLPRRAKYMLPIVLNLALACFFIYMYLAKDALSLTFTIVSFLFFMFNVCINFVQFTDDTRDSLLDGKLTNTAEVIARWKQMNMRQGICTAIAGFTWVAFCLQETWGDITQNMDHAIVVALIFALVGFFTYNRAKKVNKATSELLQQIDELRK